MMEWHVNVRKIRRYLALFMALVMMFTIVPNETFISFANQEGNETKTVTGGDVTGGDVTGGDAPELVFEDLALSVPYGTTKSNIAKCVSGGDVIEANYYESTNTGIATVDSEGQVTPVLPGTTKIRATVSGNDAFDGVWAEYDLTVELGVQEELTWSVTDIPDSIPWTESFRNVASNGTDTGRRVKYSIISMEPALPAYGDVIAEVDTKGNIIMKRPGKIVVQASKSGGDKYNDVSTQYVLNIAMAESPFKVNKKKLYIGEEFTNELIDGVSVNRYWPGSDGDMNAVVLEQLSDGTYTGKVTAKGKGKFYVWAEVAINGLVKPVWQGEYNRGNYCYEIEVPGKWRFENEGNEFTIKYNEWFRNKIVKTEDEADVKVEYSSDNEAVATVNWNGKITTTGIGKAVITAKIPGKDNEYDAEELSYTLIVRDPEQVVTFEGSAEADIIEVGDTGYKKEATAEGDNTEIVYSSSNENIATVDSQTGEVTALRGGKVTITATALANEYYDSASASYDLYIQRNVSAKLNENDNQYTIVPAGGLTGWEYEVVEDADNVIVGVDENGVVSFKGAGTAVIKAYIPTDGEEPEISDEYTLTIAKAEQTIAFEEITYALMSGSAFTVTFTAKATSVSSGDGDITYFIENGKGENGILNSIDPETGVVSFNGKAGTATIKAVKAASKDYLEAEAIYEITVNKSKLTSISFNKVPSANESAIVVTYGDNGNKFTNLAVGLGNGDKDDENNKYTDFTYSVEEGSDVVEIDSKTGEVTIKKAGIAKITATYGSTEHYGESSASYLLEIKKANQSICFDEEVYQIYVGQNFEDVKPLAKLTSGTNGGKGAITYSYVSDGNSIVKELSNGNGGYSLDLNHKEGEVVIQATKEACDCYNASETTSYTLKVVRESPIIRIKNTDFNIKCSEDYKVEVEVEKSTNHEYPITYTSMNPEVATVDQEGNLTIHRSGTVEIYVAAEENKYYYPSFLRCSIEISNETPIVTFEENPKEGKEAIEITYNYNCGDDNSDNDNIYVNKATPKFNGEELVLKDGATPSYKFEVVDDPHPEENDDIVEINSTTGEVKINRAGTVKISVTYKADDFAQTWYNEVTATYTLQINKAKQTLVMPGEDEGYTCGYNKDGILVYRICAGRDFDEKDENGNTVGSDPKARPAGNYHGTGAITYEITDEYIYTDGSPKPALTFVTEGKDAGNITFSYFAGTVTIKATKAADARYEKAEVTYKISISAKEYEGSEDPFYKDGERKNDSGWFTGDNIYIKAKEGYYLSYRKLNSPNTVWSTELPVELTEDGSTKIKFYVRDKEGNIYTQFTKDVTDEGDGSIEILKDAVPPSANIQIKATNKKNKEVIINDWSKHLTYLSKNDYPNGGQLVIQSSDTEPGSGVELVQYYIDYVDENDSDIYVLKNENELDAITDWVTYKENEPVAISNDQAFVAYAKVTDVAGNYQYASTNGIIRETTAPEISYVISSGAVATNGYYKDDIIIDVAAVDKYVYSGLKKIEYTIAYRDDDGNIVGRDKFETLYEYTKENPQYSDLDVAWNYDFLDNINIKAADYNYDEVFVIIKATDNAGNVGYAKFGNKEHIPLQICIADPKLDVIYAEGDDEKVQYTTPEGVKYFKDVRTVDIQVTRRKKLFDSRNVILEITATDANGKPVKNAYTKSAWVTDETGKDKDSVTHTMTITFTGNANYSWKFGYIDDNEIIRSEELDTFAVDRIKPDARAVVGKDTWIGKKGNVDTNSPTTIDFSRSTSGTVKVTAQASDSTSAIKSFDYYVYYHDVGDTNENRLELRNIAETAWIPYTQPVVLEKENAYFTVYFRAIDYANNVTFFNSNGYVVDDDSSKIIIDAPPAALNDYYNEDFEVQLSVEEDALAPYSGIQTIEYWIYCDNEVTKNVKLYNYTKNTNSDYTLDNLKQSWSGTIPVDAEKNNSDNVKLVIETVDNAGNRSIEERAYKIDCTIPTMELDYSPKSGNHVASENRGYYDENRTATFTITERTSTFDGEAALDTILSGITATDSKGKEVELNWDKSQMVWVHTEGATPDKATHSIQIVFAQDANYTIDESKILYTDMADNKCQNVKVEDGVQNPYAFTVDKKAPEVSVYLEGRTWSTLLDVLTFNCSNKENVQVTVSSDEDATSPYDIYYYVTDQVTPVSQNTLMTLSADKWTEYTGPVSVTKDKYCVVYFKAVDYAGNTVYLNADGYILDTVMSEIKLTPDATEIEHNGVGVYNKDVEILVEVTEPGDYSGIATVEYWVTCDGKETQRETLYDYEVDGHGFNQGTFPQQKELTQSFTEKIKVLSALNNSCNVEVTVRTKDNAGNVNEKTQKLDIDITAPAIAITYDNNDLKKVANGREYYDKNRTATVVITERTGHFNAQKATDGIVITTNDIENFKDTDIISGWTTRENAGDANAATHTATIIYAKDANYTFNMAYTDKAENSNLKSDNIKGTNASYMFTVDKQAPTGTLQVSNLGTWDELIDDLRFGLTSTVTVKVSGTQEDEISPIESVVYHKTANGNALTLAELEKITDWTTFTEFSVSPVDQFTVYKKVTDYAGNVSYISTNGVILDDRAAQIVITTPNTASGIYNSDVSIGVQVTDPKEASSGIKEVTYEVYNLGEITQRGVLYHFDNTNPKLSDLVNEVSSRIVVESAKNNSNNVIVKVNVVDNAGNSSSESKTIMIDITKPAISVSYDNNTADTSFGDKVFFKENRTATISVVERNFNPNLVNLSITNEHGAVPQLSGWTLSNSGSGNGDGTTYTAHVVFTEDGDYTFDIACSDLVGNTHSGVNYNNSLAPQAFTVDKTAPVIEVVYDNNDVKNGEYYKQERVATVRIREHNFETSRIQTEITASHDGVTVNAPTISNWSSSGDVHTATVRYVGDALYKFNISYVDMAGNQANEFAEQSFYVDKTLPEVEISGIVNESANNSTGNIGFVISAYDVNFDQFVPVVEVVYMENGKLVTKKITDEVGEITDVKNGKLYTVNNLEADGIYTIKCTVVDKAGNAFTQVSLQNKNGAFDKKNVTPNKELVLFSVNRNGSTYNMSASTKELVQTYYVKYVGNDVVIEEINSDELEEYSITLNGKNLVENQDYTVSIEGSKGEWMKYTYTIKKSLFDKEGEYRIVVSSKDKAGNNAYNDVKGTNIDFVVDRTAPVVTVTGMANNGRYQVDKQLVTIMPSDDGGALKSVLVRLVDDDGNVIRELLNLSGDELDKALADGAGKLTFEIEEGLYQNVEILCEDYSVGDTNSGSNEYAEVFSNVSVSTSRIKILWANKTLRYFVFGGAGVMAGFFFLILFKRRKKKEGQA